MICKYCGAKNEDYAAFCGQCGTPLKQDEPKEQVLEPEKTVVRRSGRELKAEPAIVASPQLKKAVTPDQVEDALWGEDSWEAEQEPWIVPPARPKPVEPEPVPAPDPEPVAPTPESVICMVCGKQIPPGELACPSCGATIEDTGDVSLWQDFSDILPPNDGNFTRAMAEDDIQTVILRPVQVVLIREKTGDQTTITEFPAIIGRSSHSDWTIAGNPAIGREHMKITCEGEDVFLEDLDSKNHTYIEGKEITERVKVAGMIRVKLADEYFVVNRKLV